MSLFQFRVPLGATPTITDYQDRVIACGVALLFAYVINFCFQGYITFGLKQNQNACLRRLMETSQVLYWFGVASMFSIYPPFFYGAFNAVIAFVTLVVLGLLHVFCVVDKKVGERSFFSILYFIYHLLITVWILVGLILAYSWSNRIYQ